MRISDWSSDVCSSDLITVQDFSSLFRFVGASDLFYNHMIQNGVYVWEGRTCFLSTAHSDDDLRHVERAVRDSVRGMRARGMLGSKSVSNAAVAPQPTSQPEHMPATPGPRSGEGRVGEKRVR